jgi:YD repeat-containing protein
VNYTSIFTFQNELQAPAGSSYAIVNGWDFSGRGMVEFHRRQLQTNQAAGSSAGSEPVLGEALHMIGYAFLAQLSAFTDLQDHIIGSKVVTHCAVGVVGQVDGSYIDMPGVITGASSLTSDTNGAVTALFGRDGHGSAFEWGTLDQHLLQGNIGAVSTIKLLDMDNSQNAILYDATSSNWSTIQALLIPGTYTSDDLAAINGYISNGYRVILPERGNIMQNGWTGVGYLATRTSPLGQEISYGISPKLKGGYPDGSISPASVSPLVAATTPVQPPPTQIASREPIDLATGAYLYDHDDLTVGTASFPFGLTLHRSYTSSNRSTSGPLGLGWSHSFAISATLNSDGLKGLGQDAPIDGAAAIAEVYVAQDLLSDPAKPLAKLVIASLAQRWFMDRLINNTVNVAMGSQTEQFMMLADGSYNPQLGSSDRLNLQNGVYTLQYKDGTTLTFNSAGNIVTWQNPAGVTVTFTYNAASPPLLTAVSNGLERSLMLSYNATNQLTSVSDTGERSIAYAYDSAGNLITFTDPLGTSLSFSYTPPGGTLTPGLLTQIFYPSLPAGIAFVTNTYDGLGRVASQANASNVPGNTTTWNYSFAGYRSEEDDASGTQHVLYYNPRGKVLFEIQDLAGLNRVTKHLYDGLDRLRSTTFPEGNSIASTYASTVNPWAHNIAAITRIPKPGSPLAATTTNFTYNATWNTVASVTDPRVLVATWLYDAQGNMLQAVADVGNAPHVNATSTFTYDAYGRVLTATDPVGTVTRYTYGAAENLIAVTIDAGPGRLNLTTSYTYDTTGNLTARTDPRGHTTTMTYDAARRFVTTTAPTPFNSGVLLVQTTNAYDPDGRVTAVTRSNGVTSQVVSTSYPRTGQVQAVTDPNGNQTRSTYDLNDRLASVTQPVAPSITRVTRFSYDALVVLGKSIHADSGMGS